MDPSHDLDEEMFDKATIVGTGVYSEGTILWKDSLAYIKRRGEERWVLMRKTGRLTVENGSALYVSSGDIRRVSETGTARACGASRSTVLDQP